MFRILAVIAVAAALVAGVVWFLQDRGAGRATTAVQRPIAVVSFVCDRGQTIDATLYERPVNPPSEPPIPGGSARIVLSDGRTFDLAQTISASGVRYATPDEAFVFWTKGNGAVILENNRQTYMGCILVAPDPGSLPKVHASGSEGFSIRYPAGYAVDVDYVYSVPSGAPIAGVKFTIAPEIASGTNLSQDTHLSVELIPQAASCNAARFLTVDTPSTTIVEDGTTYSTASWSEAAAGNRYEETIFALPGTNSCIAVRYFIHYTVFENYPPRTRVEFDKRALKEQFDAMRSTLRIVH